MTFFDLSLYRRSTNPKLSSLQLILPPLDSLPNELLDQVISNLPQRDRLALGGTSFKYLQHTSKSAYRAVGQREENALVFALPRVCFISPIRSSLASHSLSLTSTRRMLLQISDQASRCARITPFLAPYPQHPRSIASTRSSPPLFLPLDKSQPPPSSLRATSQRQ